MSNKHHRPKHTLGNDKVVYLEEIMELMKHGCMTPGCKHDHGDQDMLQLKSSCHPHAGVVVFFHKDRSSAAILCRKCARPIIFLAIGSRAERQSNSISLAE